MTFRGQSSHHADCSGGDVRAVQLLLKGDLQGHGVRPAVARLAFKYQIAGEVENSALGVRIRIEGAAEDLKHFQDQLPLELPQAAVLTEVQVSPADATGQRGFQCLASQIDGPVSAVLPVDRSVCPLCLAESLDPRNRRFQYSLNSCSECGPRYSAVLGMPWDRPRTAMNRFQVCGECEAEFRNLADRRCQSEMIACTACGPSIVLESTGETTRDMDAVAKAAALLLQGAILAVKGIGGYQFICDATCAGAVCRLRLIKRRLRKPLAIMILSKDVRGQIDLSSEAWKQLTSAVNPIVISEDLTITGLAAEVLCGTHPPGILLATSVLHHQLLAMSGRPLVVTSANQDGDPLIYRDCDALATLQTVTDGVLLHSREIVRPIDDSVVRIIGGRPVTLRAARGLAPMSLPLICPGVSVLAVGGHQKVSITVSNGLQTVLGPHVGDMQTLPARARFSETVYALSSLLGSSPDVIACDLHPDYFTSRWAMNQRTRVVPVQHHHAHVAAAMLDHGIDLHEEVLGIAFDGTGAGTDGTIWGGEFLIASGAKFRRVASLLPFPLAGGERTVAEPWRVAAVLLKLAFPEWTILEVTKFLLNRLPASESCCVNSVTHLLQDSALRSFPETSSAGRLFDGVSTILLGIPAASWEGELASELETVAAACDTASGCWRMPLLQDSGLLRVDWRPAIRNLVFEMSSGTCREILAARFHGSLAACIRQVADVFPDRRVLLSGGCFQNRVLTESVQAEFQPNSDRVCVPGRIPPNDGGLSAGQYAVAATQLMNEIQTE